MFESNCSKRRVISLFLGRVLIQYDLEASIVTAIVAIVSFLSILPEAL